MPKSTMLIVEGQEIHVMTFGACIPDTQFILIDGIGIIRSLGFVDNEGKFNWVHGKPMDIIIKTIEDTLCSLFKVGKYFEP